MLRHKSALHTTVQLSDSTCATLLFARLSWDSELQGRTAPLLLLIPDPEGQPLRRSLTAS